MQTLEAIVETNGTVRLLGNPKFNRRRRALVTILDEDPKEMANDRNKTKLIEAFNRASEMGAFKNIEDPVEWQRKLRDEWN
jgi:hypothetical protein